MISLPGFFTTDVGRLCLLSMDCLVLTPSAEAALVVLCLVPLAESYLQNIN